MNSLNLAAVITSPLVRRWIYGIYVIGVLIIGAFAAGFAATDTPQPDYLVIAIAVAGYLGAAIGLLASANTPAKGAHEAETL